MLRDAITALLNYLVAAPGNGACEAGIVETATRGTEHAVKGVHEYLDGLGERGIVVLLGFVPRPPQLLDELGKNGAVAREAGLEKAGNRIVAGYGESQCVDLECTDDARVETLEVQHQDVVVETRFGIHDIAAGAAGTVSGIAHVRGHAAVPVQPRQVEVVERGNGSAQPIHGKTGELRAAKRKLHQSRGGEDLRDQAAVFDIVGGKAGAIFPEQPVDLADLVVAAHIATRVATQIMLAAPEQRARHRLQLEAFEAPERRAQPVDTIEHHAARDPRDARAACVLRLQHSGAIAAAPHGKCDVQGPAAALDEIQIEIHDVPAEDQVRIGSRQPGKECLQQGALVGARLDACPAHRDSFIGDHEDDSAIVIAVVTVHRDGVQLAR